MKLVSLLAMLALQVRKPRRIEKIDSTDPADRKLVRLSEMLTPSAEKDIIPHP